MSRKEKVIKKETIIVILILIIIVLLSPPILSIFPWIGAHKVYRIDEDTVTYQDNNYYRIDECYNAHYSGDSIVISRHIRNCNTLLTDIFRSDKKDNPDMMIDHGSLYVRSDINIKLENMKLYILNNSTNKIDKHISECVYGEILSDDLKMNNLTLDDDWQKNIIAKFQMTRVNDSPKFRIYVALVKNNDSNYLVVSNEYFNRIESIYFLSNTFIELYYNFIE